MPWNPFFEKCEQADIFVLLGHVQFEKNNFQNRFKHEDVWRTLSVRQGLEPIREKKYVDSKSDWKRIKMQLPKYVQLLSSFDKHLSDSLWEMNTGIIYDILNRLRIPTEIQTDFPTARKGTDRLIEICKKFGATTYLSGPSGRHYLEVGSFQDAGIRVEFFEGERSSSTSILERLS